MEYINKPTNIEDLFPLVEKEAISIKENFSKEEIKKLFIYRDDIDGNSTTHCIYGTMLGTCNNSYVNTFINTNLNKCVITDNGNYDINDFEDNIDEGVENRSYYFMTPLEAYIFIDNMNYYDEDSYEYTKLKNESTMRINKVLELLND